VKILYIEDEVSASFPTVKALQREGYEVLAFATGEQALVAATDNSFSLALVDIDLGPGMDGAETATKLLQAHDLPVVFLSAHAEKAFVDRVSAISNYGYVVKNSGVFVLVQTIQTALGLHAERVRNRTLVAELQAARDAHDLILDNLADGILHFGADFCIDFKSGPYLRQMGLEGELDAATTADQVAEVIHPEDRQAVMTGMFAAIAAKSARLDCRFRVKHRKGHYYWREDRARFLYDQNGAYQGAFVICSDVSQRVADEKTIRENSSRLALILGAGRVAWWEIDLATGAVVFSDQKAGMLGYEPRDFAHYRDFTRLLHPDDVEQAMAAMQGHLDGKTPNYDFTYRIRTKAGPYLSCRDIGALVPSDPLSDGRRVAGIVIDISEQKAAEAALVERERLGVVAEIAAAVAHDFNNALQAIVGNVELAMIQPALAPKVAKHLATIKSLVFDTAQRIRPLQQLAVGSDDGAAFTPVDLNQIVTEALDQTQPLWKDLVRGGPPESAVTLELRSVSRIDGSRPALRTVLLNLIKNAVEAMPNGGNLRLETADLDTGVSLRLTDTGVGMDEPTRLRVFQPFFSTKGFDRGRGLGMSSVASIVKAHRGTAQVSQSSPGCGTTIELHFPFTSAVGEPLESPPDREAVSGLRVLWVDDEEEVRTTGSELLRSLGQVVDTAADGHAALALAELHHYDLIVTDLGMSGLDGWQLAERVRATGFLGKIVLLTGWGECVTEQQARSGALFEVLTKPVGLTSLKGLLCRVTA